MKRKKKTKEFYVDMRIMNIIREARQWEVKSARNTKKHFWRTPSFRERKSQSKVWLARLDSGGELPVCWRVARRVVFIGSVFLLLFFQGCVSLVFLWVAGKKAVSTYFFPVSFTHSSSSSLAASFRFFPGDTVDLYYSTFGHVTTINGRLVGWTAEEGRKLWVK